MYSTIKHTSKSIPFKITAYFAYIEIINKKLTTFHCNITVIFHLPGFVDCKECFCEFSSLIGVLSSVRLFELFSIWGVVEDVVRTQSYMNVILNTISYIDVYIYIYSKVYLVWICDKKKTTILYGYYLQHNLIWN